MSSDSVASPGSRFSVPLPPARTWLTSIMYIAAVAMFLRFYNLPLKPLHGDEAVNGLFLTRLVVPPHQYRYDPANYHGPTLFYAAWLSTSVFPDADLRHPMCRWRCRAAQRAADAAAQAIDRFDRRTGRRVASGGVTGRRLFLPLLHSRDAAGLLHDRPRGGRSRLASERARDVLVHGRAVSRTDVCDQRDRLHLGIRARGRDVRCGLARRGSIQRSRGAADHLAVAAGVPASRASRRTQTRTTAGDARLRAGSSRRRLCLASTSSSTPRSSRTRRGQSMPSGRLRCGREQERATTSTPRTHILRG